MSETPENPTESVTTPVATVPEPSAERPVAEPKPNRLYQAAAWVAIVAGSLFIVLVVFFAGFTMGKHSGGGQFHRHWEHGMMMDRQGPGGGMMHRHGFGGPGGGPGMMWPGGPGQGGPGGSGQGPQVGPGNPGPGNTAPGQPPQTPPSR